MHKNVMRTCSDIFATYRSFITSSLFSASVTCSMVKLNHTPSDGKLGKGLGNEARGFIVHGLLVSSPHDYCSFIIRVTQSKQNRGTTATIKG